MYQGTANNCTISSNSASDGGGVHSVTVKNCTISGNTATGSGGGMMNAWNFYGTVTDCIISGNTATDRAGGANGGRLYNCTVVDNYSDLEGGGVWASSSSSTLLKNCILWGNTATTNVSDVGNIASAKVILNSCASELMNGVGGNISMDPLFVDAAGGDYRLLSNSPCINWGNNAFVDGPLDLDGNTRIIEGHVDMGCYEYATELGVADRDGDGMLDEWEHQWFGGNVLPDDNPDSDPQSNGDEFISGTDPTNAASYFYVTTDTTTDGNPSQHIIINWEAVTGRVYNVLWTPSMMEPFQPLEIGIQYPQNSYTDTVHTVELTGFYRVVVMRVDYDADGDGLPNDWENRYAVADADDDGDEDGFDNMSEFIAGTDPTNSASFFTASQSLADVGGSNCFVVEWISIPDRLYSVQWSTNLLTGFETIEADIQFPLNSYTDLIHSAESQGFYQVDVRLK